MVSLGARASENHYGLDYYLSNAHEVLGILRHQYEHSSYSPMRDLLVISIRRRERDSVSTY